MHLARVLLFVSAILVASCGESSLPSSPDLGSAPGTGVIATPPPPPPALATPTGRLSVMVTDTEGNPLSSADVFVTGIGFMPGFNSSYFQRHASDQAGVAMFEATPRYVRVCANHAIGGGCQLDAEISQTGSTVVPIVIVPALPVTVAMLPVTVGSLSADRTEFEFRISLFALPETGFTPHSYWRENATPVFLRLDSCWVHLDHFSTAPPTCNYYSGTTHVSVLDYMYDPTGTPALHATGSNSAMLLLEQSQRVSAYDPYGLRSRAAKRFVERTRAGSQHDLIAIAGFAGPGPDASNPALLPQLPLWVPAVGTTAFSTETPANMAALDALQPLFGGNAPVLEALSAALSLTAAQASTTQRRSIVAVLGGDDDSGMSEMQRKAALASLRQKQADTGIQVVLVVGRLDAESAERARLGELAAALRAPIIYAGYPSNWLVKTDGLYAALELAADLLSGKVLPNVNAKFRMKSDQPGGFQTGSTLHGTVFVESDQCPMGCGELPYQFAVEIP